MPSLLSSFQEFDFMIVLSCMKFILLELIETLLMPGALSGSHGTEKEDFSRRSGEVWGTFKLSRRNMNLRWLPHVQTVDCWAISAQQKQRKKPSLFGLCVLCTYLWVKPVDRARRGSRFEAKFKQKSFQRSQKPWEKRTLTQSATHTCALFVACK